jgi:catechol 2,3-dioxygenase-like lactoylglutathione lyase family enzyme
MRKIEGLQTLSRRKLLGTLGAAAGTAGFTANALAQSGGCRDGYGQLRCPLPLAEATAPIKEVFDPTGWKTTALESFTMDVVDYKKEAAFYAALLGWTLRDDDGRQAIMDIGDLGSCILRAAAPGSFGPGANGGPPPRAAIRSFGWVIDKWDATSVAAELRKRGMTPVAENRGAFQSFRVKDPDGWNLQICNNKGLSAARRKPAAAKLSWPAPFAPTGWKTVWFDHFSYRGSNYKRSASFYANLLGWERTFDEGTQIELMAGDVGDVICRGGNPFLPAQPPNEAVIDHISYGIAPWDVEKVREALETRGLHVQTDTATSHIGPDNKKVADDIYQAAYQSYHTDTPSGFSLQLSWVTHDKRLVGANADKPKALRKYPAP